MSNIKQHRSNGIDWLIVEVPKRASDMSTDSLGRIFYYYQGGMDYRILPSGNCELYATLDKISEEQAEQVVEHETGMMCAWYRNHSDSNDTYGSAVDSFASLIRSLFPDHANHNYVILKQIKKDEQQ